MGVHARRANLQKGKSGRESAQKVTGSRLNRNQGTVSQKDQYSAKPAAGSCKNAEINGDPETKKEAGVRVGAKLQKTITWKKRTGMYSHTALVISSAR